MFSETLELGYKLKKGCEGDTRFIWKDLYIFPRTDIWVTKLHLVWQLL